MKPVTIYALKDPRFPWAIRYIGQTRQPLSVRLRGHITEEKCDAFSTSPKNLWIKQLRSIGVIPVIEPIECVAAQDADAVELEYIHWSRLFRLSVNSEKPRRCARQRNLVTKSRNEIS